MINQMKALSATGAKTAQACDSCLRIRARWFCAADDAFLCHACDGLVHSANQLASRHERVRLQTASSNNNKLTTQTWHSGFTRKARTPRHNKHLLVQKQPKNEGKKVLFSNTSTLLPLVPELGSEESLLDYENEEHVLCQVPVFDPFEEEALDLDNFPEFLPSDIDLAVLAADVESLLGNVDDEDSGHMNGSGLFGCKEEDEIDHPDVGVIAKGAMVPKVKDEELEADHAACHQLESVLDMTREGYNWNNIGSESLAAAAHEEEETVAVPVVANGGADKVGTKKERFLRLNHEKVITAWASQGSPWTTENPSEFNSDDCWPDYLGSSGAEVQWSYGEVRSLRGCPIGSGDGGREARVSKYREKRRTRLFSKKIRYEVRKLNAEKRPRMKGRFVKRASFVGDTTFPA